MKVVIDIDEAYYTIIKNDVERGMDYKSCVIIAKGKPYKELETGNWIEKEDDYDVYFDCSNCGSSFWTEDNEFFMRDTKYCPNCGARMVEPQESEE